MHAAMVGKTVLENVHLQDWMNLLHLVHISMTNVFCAFRGGIRCSNSVQFCIEA